MKVTRKVTKKELNDFENSPLFQHAKETVANVIKPLKDLENQIKTIKESKLNNSVYLVQPKLQRTVVENMQNEMVIFYDPDEYILSRKVEGKTFNYQMSKGAKTFKLFESLLKAKRFLKVEELVKYVESASKDALRKSVRDFNYDAKNMLRLNKVKVIQGKKGFGYRINPNIHIEKE